MRYKDTGYNRLLVGDLYYWENNDFVNLSDKMAEFNDK